VGRLRWLPGQLDAKGIGIFFASDGARYDREAIELVHTLAHDGIGAWFTAAPQFHVKIYSLSYAVFGPLVGFNIIAVEPLNALYYLTTVYLSFAIGQRVFSRRVGFLSALIVALWPSFLLHSTQLLRDPLVIALWLLLILVLSSWLTRILQWRGAIVYALLGFAASLGLWINRIDIWMLLVGSTFIASLLLVVRQLRDRKFLFANSLTAACLLWGLMIIPWTPQVAKTPKRPAVRATVLEKQPSLFEPIMDRRRMSIVWEVPGATSSVDKDVFFNSNADIIRYLPRAAEIGFFAPFPNTWFERGIRERSATWFLVGLETLAMYAIEIFACLTVWRSRRRLSLWLIVLIAAMGVVGLALVTVNIGTLYRYRYSFLILLIIVASESLMNFKLPKILKQRGLEEAPPRPNLNAAPH